MYVRYVFALAAAILLHADIPDVAQSQSTLPGILKQSFPSNSAPRFAVLAAFPQSAADTPLPATLQPQSRLAIVRFVDGEFAKMVEPLPRGKQGFKIPVGKPLDSSKLLEAVRTEGAAASKGDTVQITNIEFRSKEIVFEINGGGKKHFHLREHLQVGMGGSTSPISRPDAHPHDGQGATLILDYGVPLPNMSPDDLKQELSVFLDFSQQHSATVNWVETLPPEFQEGIKDHKAVEGMDQDMVIAAMGRPDRKVRERDPDGNETEDWIFGNPPAKTTFVTFSGGKVIRVREFN
jgi:hypothetical protein